MIKVCPTCGGPVEVKFTSTKPVLQSPLSPREVQALETYARLGSAKLVGTELGLSEQTIKNFLLSARYKLDTPTSMQAVLKYYGVNTEE